MMESVEMLEVTKPEISKENQLPKEKLPNATIFSTYFNLVNTSIGAGILALPFACKVAGVVGGIVLLIGIAIIELYTAELLIICCNKTGKYSYKGLAMKVFGKYAGIIFELANVVLCFGVLTVYVVLIGQVLGSQFSHWLPISHPLGSPYLIAALVLGLIVFPLCALRKIQFLSYTSFIAIVSILYLVSIVLVKFFQRLTSDGIPWNSVTILNLNWTALQALPIQSFAFAFHMNLLPMYKELKNRTPWKMGGVTMASVITCFILYATVGITGYFAFADSENLTGNILDAFPNDDPICIVAKFALATVIIFSYPLLHYSVRHSWDSVVYGGRYSPVRWIVTACVICIASYMIGMFVADIVILFGLFMTTAGCLTIMIFPALVYIRLEIKKKWYKTIPAFIVLAVSSILGIVCFGLTVIDVYQSFKNKYRN